MALRRAFETVTEGLTVLEYIATNLPVLAVPVNFIPTFMAAPVEPTSLEEMFGPLSLYTYKEMFNQFWDRTALDWTTPSLTLVTPLVRADIAAQLVLINAWVIAYAAWEIDYLAQKEIQWRTKMAIDLKAWIAPLDV